MSAKAYIGIGSNLGDRQSHINDAIDILGQVEGISVLRASSVYETEPVGGPPQDKYLNGVIEIETTLEPHLLLEELTGIEKLLGREREVVSGPRTIDLDILTYGDLTLRDETLTIPHPRMHEREFVLKGLRELGRI